MNKKDIQPQAQYRVQLKARTQIFGRMVHPGQALTLRGDVLASVWPNVASAQPLASATAQPGI